MRKGAVLTLLERAAGDDGFLAQLTEDFAGAVKSYDLTRQESAALSSSDVRWIEAHIGKLDARLSKCLDCRLQQERW
jgi:hypothetical protein